MRKLTPATRERLAGARASSTSAMISKSRRASSTCRRSAVRPSCSRTSRASTETRQRYTYGTHGTPTTEALKEAWNDLSGAAGTVLVPSGLAAIVVGADGRAAVGRPSADDRLRPISRPDGSARTVLKRMGVETTYYDPEIGAGIADLIRPNTKAIFTEAPGSQSLDMQDIPAIVAAAQARGVCVHHGQHLGDADLLSRPRARRRHRDRGRHQISLRPFRPAARARLSANAEWFPRLHRTVDQLAIPPGPEDVFLALRGLRTMDLRLREAERQALALAQWLQGAARSAARHPPRPARRSPGTRSGSATSRARRACSVWCCSRRPSAAVAALVDCLELFGLGYSWGGYESLRDPVRLHEIPHRDALGAGRPDAADQRRARRHRGSQGRPRAGFCGVSRRAVARRTGALISKARIVRQAPGPTAQ